MSKRLFGPVTVCLSAAAILIIHGGEGPMEREDAPDSPDEAADYYRLKRAPPGMDIPVERYLAAWERMRGMGVYSTARQQFLGSNKDGSREVSIGSWEELGPGNVGGRTRALLIRPDDDKVMYAAGVAGGVWKTTDGGLSWRQLNDLLPNLSVGHMAMDPANPDVIYVGTGESFAGDGLRGVGIFKSTDGGATFNLLESTRNNSNFYYINRLLVSPNDSQHVYAATLNGVWRSVDGGENWTQTLTSLNLRCEDLVARTDQAGDYLFAACRTTTSGTIFRNIDAAATGTWEVVFGDSNMRRTSLAIAPSSQSVIYAMAASGESGDFNGGLLGVYRSTSNGDRDTWEARVTNKDPSRLNSGLLSNRQSYFADICSNGTKSFSNQGNYDNTLAVDPTNPEIVWAGGIDLFRSDDGGKNWGVASFWNTTPGTRAYVHADQHVLLFHPKYDGAGNQILFSAGDGGLYRTENARATVAGGVDRLGCSPVNTQVAWATMNNNYAVTQFYHGAVYPGGHFYFGGTQDNGTPIGSDADGPQAWDALIGGDGGFAGVDSSDVNRLYGETQRAATLTWFRRSLNGGRSFTSAMTGIDEPAASTNFLFITPYTLDPSEPKRIYLGGRTLWRTDNGAGRWTAASAQVLSGIISAIAIAPSNTARVMMGTSTGFIHRIDDAISANAATTWPRALPRSGVVSAIAFDPSNQDVAYAVYSTFDSGSNAGHVFKTEDGGVTWSRIDGAGDTGIPDIPAQSIAVHPAAPSTIYVGTDMGIFVTLDGGATWAREDTQFPTTSVEWLTIDSGNNGPVLYAFTHGRGAWRVRLSEAPPCSFKVTTPDYPAFGGTLPVHVETGEGCVWSAVPLTASPVIESPGRGLGTADLIVTMPVNTGTTSIESRIEVATEMVTIHQNPPILPSNNDEPSRPFTIGPLPWVGVQDTRLATSSPNDPEQSCIGNSRGSRTVWYVFTANFSGTLAITARGTRYDNGNTYGIVLSGFNANGAAPGDQLACAAGATVGAPAFERVTFAVTQGFRYLVEVSGNGVASVGGYTVVTASREN